MFVSWELFNKLNLYSLYEVLTALLLVLRKTLSQYIVSILNLSFVWVLSFTGADKKELVL